MKKQLLFFVLIIAFISFSCEKEKDEKSDDTKAGNIFIANDSIAKESVLRSIPDRYLDSVRNNLHVAYQHTSHGTHVSYGVFGLPNFKVGDELKFGVANSASSVANKLQFQDNALASYGTNASDLSANETAFIEATRKFLDDAANAEINVVMWSWCSISGHSVQANYLTGMQTLINEYGKGGSKIGTGGNQRKNAVTFIFMTGHAEKDNNLGTGKPKNQADLILNFCKENKYYCLDYYNIDTHDMDGNYWDDAGDDGNSADGGNFYTTWQNSHTKGVHWYENKEQPNGTVTFGQHNTQHITANRKAYAMWWILARIAGWNGEASK